MDSRELEILARKLARILLLALFLSLVIPVASPEGAEASVSTTNLILNVDGKSSSSYSGSGTTWTDLSGTGNHLTLGNARCEGALPSWNSTVGGGSFHLLGGNSCFFRSSLSSAPQIFSLFFWIKPTAFPTSGYSYLAQLGRDGTRVDGEYMLGFNQSGQLYFWDYRGGVYGYLATSGASSTKIVLNEWQYVGFVKNGTTGSFYIGKAGVLNNVGNPTGTNVSYEPHSFAVGMDYRDKNQPYAGYIGAIHYYSTNISASTATDNYSATLRGAPTLVSNPVITGTATYGSSLSASTGAHGNSPTSYTYAWSRATTIGGTYSPIAGATNSTYSLTASDVGRYLKVSVTATNADGSITGTSSASDLIAAKPLVIKAADRATTFSGSAATITNSYSITGGGLVGSDTFTSLTYTYTSASPSYNSVTAPTNAGAYTITPSAAVFSVGSASSYAITYDTATLTIARADQAAFSLSTTSGTYLTNLRLLSSGGSDTGTVTFAVSSVGTAGCSISNSDSLTSTSAGSCQVVATKAATNNYFAAYDTQTVTLGKASLTLTISVTGSSTVKYGSSAVTSYTTNRSLGTGNTANISGTVSYSTVGSTACSINSSTGAVLMTAAAGACSVRVSLASDPNYLDTNSSAISLTAAKADTLTVTASAVNLTYTGDSQTVSYQYSISGLKFSDTLTALSYNYSGTTNSGAFTSGSASVNQAGVYTITPSAATISNIDSYTAVTYATGTLTVNRASRTITGSSVASVKYGSQESVTVTTSPLSSSDGAVTFAAGTSTACTVVSGTGIFTMNRAEGTCLIVPTIAQGANYLAATGSEVSIIPAKADAVTITARNSTATYTGSPISVSPSYSVSGLIGTDTVTVTYQYSGTENSGGIYSLSSTAPTNAGSYLIVPVVTQLNSDSYTATANLVNGTLTVGRATRSLEATTYSSTTLKYGATSAVVSNTTTPNSNSDGLITYSIGEGCSINSSTGLVTATSSSGTCSQVTTINQGNNYESATAQSVVFTLAKADTLTVTSLSPSPITYTGNSAVVTPAISVSGLVNNDSAAGATFSYGRATTCATGGACVVGDTGPGGGTVFYVSETAINAADGIGTGGRYLEAAPSTFSKTTFTWCTGFTNSNTTTIGGTSTAIGTGAINTKIVSSRCSGGAVYEAANLTLGGKSDWFLPSAGELLQMYNQRSILGFGPGTTAANYLYWGSNETANWVAASLVPANGVGGQNKAQATPYWPIRAFSPSATTYATSTTAPTNAGSYTITPSVLTLTGGRSIDNYLSVIYETSTLTISKANQIIFSNYSSLEAVLGSTFTIYPFGGSGDGAVYLAVANGTATGCSASTSSVTASSAGTCILTITKSANENYNEAQSSFTITFFYFVPVATPPVSTTPTQIAIDAPTAWSTVATAAPEITSFTPSSGGVGAVITITGTGFDGVTSVKIGRKVLTSVTGVNSTTLTVVIPSGTTSGPIVVTNEFGSDFSDSNFVVTP